MRILFYIFCIINFTFSFDFSNLDNIKADFKQIVKSDNQIIEYKGSFSATRQNQYFQYDKPIKKQVLINNGQTIVYEPNLNQAILFSNNNEDGIVNVLKNAKQDGNKIISNINDNIFFIFLDSNDMPSKIEYTDKFDNNNEIILNNVKINTDIDEDIFVFKIPEGTDIIHSKSSTFKR